MAIQDKTRGKTQDKKTGGGFSGVLGALELDPRLLGMVGALLAVWLIFNAVTDGTFLTPRNLWNLVVQTSVVGIVATGMVLVSSRGRSIYRSGRCSAF